MRKLITLGSLTLLLTMLASPVFAGNEVLCDPLKDSDVKGLYGLCIAFHNASDGVAQDRILENFNRKSGDSGITMPGVDGGICPCFNSDDLSNAGLAFGCAISSSGTGLDLALYQIGNRQFGTDSLGCFNWDLTIPDFINLGTTPEENQKCRDLILEAIGRDFSGLICQEGDV